MEKYNISSQEIYFFILTVAVSYFVLLGLLNAVWMKRHTKRPRLTEGPLVSVLVPARNEEATIERCLNSLLNQNYRNYEILVLDDNSTDRTAEIVRKLAAKHPRIHFFHGEALPADWYGKPFALRQLADKAKGEIIILTDADTVHRSTSISWAITNMASSKADFLSGYVGQELGSFGEIVTVPLMYMLTGFIIPIFLNGVSKSGLFSVAVGQFIALKKELLEKTGGFEVVRKKTSEDIYLARHMRKMGYRTVFLDMKDQVFCRMYEGYENASIGIGKNIFDFFNKKSAVLFVIIIAAFLFLLMPFPLLIRSCILHDPHLYKLIFVNILYAVMWAFLLHDRGIKWYYGLLWPILFLNLLYMAIMSWWRTSSGEGFLWKERVVG